MITDTIADLLTRIRNAQRAGHPIAKARVSRAGERLLKVMQQEGFIEGFEIRESLQGGFPEYVIQLRYVDGGVPMIREAKRVSRPGRRVYAKAGEVPRVNNGLGVAIVSTSQGVLADREARKRGIGGEILARIG